jgi:CHAT domain-containing protein
MPTHSSSLAMSPHLLFRSCSITALLVYVLLSLTPFKVRAGDLSDGFLAKTPSVIDDARLTTVKSIKVSSPVFKRSSYNPAVLHLRYTSASGKTTNQKYNAFIDFTLIGSDSVPQGRRIELNSQRFKQLLGRLYSSLSRQEVIDISDPVSPSRQLFDILIAPILPLLSQQKITTLLISADRGLQAIPFSALSDGEKFFGDRFAFSLTPSLVLTNFEDLDQLTGNKLLALGASQFDGLSPLPLVPQELDGIIYKGAKEKFLNNLFTPNTFLEEASDPIYSNVHVATHADFHPGGPTRSQIHSGTGPIAFDQLIKLRRSRKGVPLELIVFSACRTALGDSESELGFAGLALQAGAKSAVGTLWYVDDVVTSAYFVQMYRYLSQGTPKAEAMQLTRQAFIRGLVRLDGNRVVGADGIDLLTGLSENQQRRVANGINHPFYWSGIQLMGTPW